MEEDFTEQQLSEFEEAFNLFAQDDDGISIHDLGTVMRSLEIFPTISELASYVQTYDPEGTGKISYEYFKQLMAEHLHGLDTPQKILNDYLLFDKSGRGTVSAKEIRYVFEQKLPDVPKELVDKIVRESDKAGNGQFDFKDFISIVLGEL